MNMDAILTAATANCTTERVVSDFKFKIDRFKAKLESYVTHIIRGTYENQVRGIVTGKMRENGAIIVADWKMKWLMEVFRESQVQFFGKAGICWHGAMVIRKATAAEMAEDAQGGSQKSGSLRVFYFDAVTDDKKECAFGTLSALEVQLQTYLQHTHRAFRRADNRRCRMLQREIFHPGIGAAVGFIGGANTEPLHTRSREWKERA
jgi:hypothetical protein